MHSKSWTTLLLNHYEAKVINLGIEGAYHELAIESFDSSADITIFVWTDPNRLVNRRKYPLNYASARKGVLEKRGRTYQAALAYYEWLHDPKYAMKRQTRDLYWFDTKILSTYKKPIIHLWSFHKTYSFQHGVEFTTPLKVAYNYIPIAENNILHLNHMTEADNESLFNAIKTTIDSYVTVA
jgi:hypothetical protein